MSIRIKRTGVTGPTAKLLKESLEGVGVNTRLLLSSNSSWSGAPKSLLVNWGCTAPIGDRVRAKVLNKPSKIKNATDKIKTFKLLADQGISHPWFVLKSEHDFIEQLANKAFATQGKITLFFRTTATGFGGEGINVLENIREKTEDFLGMVDPGYDEYLAYFTHLKHSANEWSSIIRNTVFVSEYFKARDEYRIHVICGGVAFSQRKSLRTDDDRPETPNFQVRNHANGFIFQQNDVEVPEIVKAASVKAVAALGLDFGAVDIKYNAARGTYSILEVNTAPAIQNSTLARYTEVFSSIHKILQEG